MTSSQYSNQLCNSIKKRLALEKIEVSVQRAITTDSIYIRLDRGILGSLRIGDHSGRSYQYTYEIGSHIRKYAEIPQGYNGHEFMQYKYPQDQIKRLVQQVVIQRANLKSKYSAEGYTEMVKSSMR